MFKCTFDTDNAAFFDDDECENGNNEAKLVECARILRHLADHIENGAEEGKVMDVNGNSIGEWSIE